MNLEQKLISSGWFKMGRTLEETFKEFNSKTKSDIFRTVLHMFEYRILCGYPSKTGYRYRLTIQEDIISDIGV